MASCLPDDGILSGDNTFSARVDGDRISTVFPTAERNEFENSLDPDNPFRSALIAGVHLGTQNVLSLNIISLTDLATGEYELDGTCTNFDNCTLLSYIVTVDGGDNMEFTTGNDSLSTVKVNILEIDYQEDGRIRGTFSGTLFDVDTGDLLTITDGDFDLAFRN